MSKFTQHLQLGFPGDAVRTWMSSTASHQQRRHLSSPPPTWFMPQFAVATGSYCSVAKSGSTFDPLCQAVTLLPSATKLFNFASVVAVIFLATPACERSNSCEHWDLTTESQRALTRLQKIPWNPARASSFSTLEPPKWSMLPTGTDGTGPLPLKFFPQQELQLKPQHHNWPFLDSLIPLLWTQATIFCTWVLQVFSLIVEELAGQAWWTLWS